MSNKDDYLLNDDENIVEELPKKEEEHKKESKIFKNHIVITVIVMIVVSALIFGLVLLWQRRYDLWAVSNAFWLTFALEFFLAWIFFVYNKNILSPLIHGFKVFGLMLVGKRTKESYYEYMMKIEENPIPKYIYYIIFIFSFILLIPAVITMLMLM